MLILDRSFGLGCLRSSNTRARVALEASRAFPKFPVLSVGHEAQGSISSGRATTSSFYTSTTKHITTYLVVSVLTTCILCNNNHNNNTRTNSIAVTSHVSAR
jgi:hypothetical protein